MTGNGCWPINEEDNTKQIHLKNRDHIIQVGFACGLLYSCYGWNGMNRALTTTNNIIDRETINLLNSISTIKQNPVLSSLQAENPAPFSLGNAITQPLHHPSYYHLTCHIQNSLSVLKHLSIPKLFSLSLSKIWVFLVCLRASCITKMTCCVVRLKWHRLC
jgi:hypothetical protein